MNQYELEWLIAASFWFHRSPATLSVTNSRVTSSRSLVVTTSKVRLDFFSIFGYDLDLWRERWT